MSCVPSLVQFPISLLPGVVSARKLGLVDDSLCKLQWFFVVFSDVRSFLIYFVCVTCLPRPPGSHALWVLYVVGNTFMKILRRKILYVYVHVHVYVYVYVYVHVYVYVYVYVRNAMQCNAMQCNAM